MPAAPIFMYHHCRDGEGKVNTITDRTNVVVFSVVEDTFPQP